MSRAGSSSNGLGTTRPTIPLKPVGSCRYGLRRSGDGSWTRTPATTQTGHGGCRLGPARNWLPGYPADRWTRPATFQGDSFARSRIISDQTTGIVPNLRRVGATHRTQTYVCWWVAPNLPRTAGLALGRCPSFCTFLTTAWPEPPAVRSFRGEPGSAASRQAWFPRVRTHTPRDAFRPARRAGRFSQRTVKDPAHDPVILSIRQDRRLFLEANLKGPPAFRHPGDIGPSGI